MGYVASLGYIGRPCVEKMNGGVAGRHVKVEATEVAESSLITSGKICRSTLKKFQKVFCL
jgi:hypothetical protein